LKHQPVFDVNFEKLATPLCRRKMLFLTGESCRLVDIGQLASVVDETVLHGFSSAQIDELIHTLRSIATRS
jgi:hypothetical protein